MATAPLRSKVKDKARKQLWDSLLEVYEKEADKENVADCEEVNVTELETWTLSHPRDSLRALPQLAKANPQLVCTALAGNEVSPTIKGSRKRRLEQTDCLKVEDKLKKAKKRAIKSKTNEPFISEKGETTKKVRKSTSKLKSSLGTKPLKSHKKNLQIMKSEVQLLGTCSMKQKGKTSIKKSNTPIDELILWKETDTSSTIGKPISKLNSSLAVEPPTNHKKVTKVEEQLLETVSIDQKGKKHIKKSKASINKLVVSEETETVSTDGKSTCKLKSSLAVEPTTHHKKNRKRSKPDEQLLETDSIEEKRKKPIKKSKASTNKIFITEEIETGISNRKATCSKSKSSLAAEPSTNHKKNRKKSKVDEQLLETYSIEQKGKKSIKKTKASTNNLLFSEKTETGSTYGKSTCKLKSLATEPTTNQKKSRKKSKLDEQLLGTDCIEQPKKNKESANRVGSCEKLDPNSATPPLINVPLKRKPKNSKEVLLQTKDKEEVLQKVKECNSTISKGKKCNSSDSENIKKAVNTLMLPNQIKSSLLEPLKIVNLKKKLKQNKLDRVNLEKSVDANSEGIFPKRKVQPRATSIVGEKDNASNHKCDLKLRYYNNNISSCTRPDGRVFSCKLIFKVCECMESDEIF